MLLPAYSGASADTRMQDSRACTHAGECSLKGTFSQLCTDCLLCGGTGYVWFWSWFGQNKVRRERDGVVRKTDRRTEQEKVKSETDRHTD